MWFMDRELREPWAVREVFTYHIYGSFHLLHVCLDTQKHRKNNGVLISHCLLGCCSLCWVRLRIAILIERTMKGSWVTKKPWRGKEMRVELVRWSHIQLVQLRDDYIVKLLLNQVLLVFDVI
jgi:hypothetical protein